MPARLWEARDDETRMIQLLLQLEVYGDDNGIVRRNRTTSPRWAWLRANRGFFDVEHTDSGIEIVANNRSDWISWVELATEPINETTVEMMARVIQDVAADVLGVVEAENRPSLDRFNQERLPVPYEHVMLIDGNDTRGIDVGIMTTAQVEIVNHAKQRGRTRPRCSGRASLQPGLRRVPVSTSQRCDRLGAPEPLQELVGWRWAEATEHSAGGWPDRATRLSCERRPFVGAVSCCGCCTTT